MSSSLHSVRDADYGGRIKETQNHRVILSSVNFMSAKRTDMTIHNFKGQGNTIVLMYQGEEPEISVNNSSSVSYQILAC